MEDYKQGQKDLIESIHVFMFELGMQKGYTAIDLIDYLRNLKPLEK